MPVDPAAPLVITGFEWVPDFARGHVRDYRARWACEEIGLPYAERFIGGAGNRPVDYLHEQPWGQVPVIHDNGVEMFESGAIMLHIAHKDARLLPSDPQARARATSWLFSALNTVEPLLFEWINVTEFARDEEWARLRRPSLAAFIGKRFDQLAAALGDNAYLEGSFTIGDLAMASVLRNAEDSDMLTARPVLAAYLARCLGRPAFHRAIEAQLASFKADA